MDLKLRDSMLVAELKVLELRIKIIEQVLTGYVWATLQKC